MDDQTASILWATAVGFGLAFVSLTAFGVLLYKAGKLPNPAPIIISLSMLTAVALVLGIVESSDTALTLAATGVGALAGALSSLYQDKRKFDATKEDDDDDAA